MPEMEHVIQELGAKVLRERLKIMVGGASVSESSAEKIGADGYGATAEAVQLARRLIDEVRE